MRIKIQKWGNSLALRIPKAFAFQSKIKEDGYVNVKLDDNKIIIEPDEEIEYNLDELIARIKQSNLHNEIFLGNREGNEIW